MNHWISWCWGSRVGCRYNVGSADHFRWRWTYRDLDGAVLHGWWWLLHRWRLGVRTGEGGFVLGTVTHRRLQVEAGYHGLLRILLRTRLMCLIGYLRLRKELIGRSSDSRRTDRCNTGGNWSMLSRSTRYKVRLQKLMSG